MGYAQTKEEVSFFARVVSERERLFVGDSCVVNIVLYSSHPFVEVESSPQQPRIRGGHTRALPRYGQRLQERVRMKEGVFYALVWEQVVVGREEVGKIHFSTMNFNGSFAVYEESQDPFERFFGFAPRQRRVVKAKCKLTPFELPVEERPKRSTRDLMSSGGKVA